MKYRKKILPVCLVAILLCAKANYLTAQDTAGNNKWHFVLEPYIMCPNMHGTMGLDGLPGADVDENPADIFKNLQIGAMLYAEASKGFWTISSDLIYMKLKSDVNIKNGIVSGTAKMEQLAWELAGMRQLAPWFELGLALQVNSMKSDVDLIINSTGGPLARTSSVKETWVDPSVLVRVKTDLSQKWFFQFRANIGGGGIGSNLYWQLQSYFGYRFSRLFQLSAGYRVIYIDYENGSGSDRFDYNMTTFGPVLRFGFNLK
jgi:hypothetical protein